MIRVGLVGLGKMGISHLAILNSHPEIELVGVCDSAQYVLGVLGKYTGVRTFDDYKRMIEETRPSAIVIATPSSTHAEIAQFALERDIDVFCEKPFVLDPVDGEQLVRLARQRGRVTQVGYHYRFVAAFQEARRIVSTGALGTIQHVRAEAHGPVVLRPAAATWRGSAKAGGGCLYDYASHAIDLVNYLVGPPTRVGGTSLQKVFSRGVDDQVYATLHFADGATGQLCANWSDESQRRMTTKISIWGTNGRIVADRQECQVYLRAPVPELPGFPAGWTVRYTTDLTPPVWYYLRGEEYSAQIDGFVRAAKARDLENLNSFASALETDRVVAMLIRDANGAPAEGAAAQPRPETESAPAGIRAYFKRVFS